jgi:serine/threonine protein kinase
VVGGTASAEATLRADGTCHRPEDRTAEDPKQIGRFRVCGVLGEGAHGRVFRALDERLERPIAIKVLHHPTANARRLLAEARALAKLDHANMVRVYEVGQHGGLPFVAMELIDGVPLHQWQRAEKRSWNELLDVYLQAAAGLAAAHDRGMVHRDFKPHNVMVSHEDGHPRARILDLGLVRIEDEHRAGGDAQRSFMSTSSERRLGTPAYMAPEQYLGARATAATDQFAFCVSLWEALHGVRPFERATLAERMAAIVSGEPPAVRRSKVPARIRRALARGLSARESERHPGMRALMESLQMDPGWLLQLRRALSALTGIGSPPASQSSHKNALSSRVKGSAENGESQTPLPSSKVA